MDKLERYLDQVCRGIAGPRSLRQHIRRELREHLLDAAGEHRSAGMGEDEALERAMCDFGGPHQVRAELEATHGHRLLGVVIDKAMQWKENTMKAKWLWAAWAHVAVVLVIAAEVAVIAMAVVFIWPKHMALLKDVLVPENGSAEAQGVLDWGASFLNVLRFVNHNLWWLVILLVAAWALFEWRVRSENKTLIRLTVLGTAALGLTLAVAWMMAVMVLPYHILLPGASRRAPEPGVRAQIAEVDASIESLRQATPRHDWDAMQRHVWQASRAMRELAASGSAAPAVLALREPGTTEEIRAQFRTANESLHEARQAVRDHDAPRLEAVLREFEETYGRLRTATTMPAQGR